MENIIRLIIEEVIMSDRHMSDGQLYSFLQIFSTLSTVTDYVLLIFIVIPL